MAAPSEARTVSTACSTDSLNDDHNNTTEAVDTILTSDSKTASLSSSSSSSSTTTSKTAAATSAIAETHYPVWHNAVAGGVAGAISRVATAPLDLIRIRRQIQPQTLYPRESLLRSFQNVIHTESGGFYALFRGNTPALALWIGYAAVQFGLYQRTRQYIQSMIDTNAGGHQQQQQQQQYSTVSAFAAGAFAGTCATVVTYPFDVCRTIFAAKGIDMPSHVTPMTITTTATMPPITHASPYTHTNRFVPFSSLVEPDFRNSSPSQGLYSYPSATKPSSLSSNQGLVSAGSSTSVVVHSSKNVSPPRTLTEFSRRLYHTRGMVGFYAGCGPAVVQIIPYMGLNFAIYDTLTSGDKRVTISAYAGSISGAISKIIVYPLDTVKRRLQAQAFFESNTVLPNPERASQHSLNNTNQVHSTERYKRQTKAKIIRIGNPVSIRTYFTTSINADTVRTRSHHFAPPYQGMMDCIRSIWRNEGITGFYRGVTPSVLKTTIASGLSFALFRGTKNILEVAHDNMLIKNKEST
jgi:hypothetical protein